MYIYIATHIVIAVPSQVKTFCLGGKPLRYKMFTGRENNKPAKQFKGFRKSLKLTRFPRLPPPQVYMSSKDCLESLSVKLSCLEESKSS